MNIFKIALTCLLITLSTNATFAQSLTGKNPQELKKMQSNAVANENYGLAERIKIQLERIEANEAKISKLEEEKKDAILIEDYDKAEKLENQIEALKSGNTAVSVEPKATPSAVVETPAPVNFQAINTTPSSPSNDNAKQDMSRKNFTSLGFGFGSETVSFQLAADFLFPSKYFRAGIYYNYGINYDTEVIAFDFGMQAKGLADFESIVLPYIAIGLGLAIDSDGEVGPGFIYSVGSYLFFNQNRGFGLFYELNINVTHFDEYPLNRFGIVWTGLKRKHR